MAESKRKTPTGPRPDGTASGAGAGRPTRNERALKPDAAFDLWLERGLHKLFDDVANEPIPEALLKIIERGGGKS